MNNVTRSGAWEPWILSLVNAVNETARWTTAKILAMRSLLLETTRHIQRQAPSLYSRELVELVFAHPYCRIANLVQAGLAKRQTASVYLKQLSDIGILDDVKVGRDKLFIHLKLVALLKSEQHAFPLRLMTTRLIRRIVKVLSSSPTRRSASEGMEARGGLEARHGGDSWRVRPFIRARSGARSA